MAIDALELIVEQAGPYKGFWIVVRGSALKGLFVAGHPVVPHALLLLFGALTTWEEGAHIQMFQFVFAGVRVKSGGEIRYCS